MIFAVKIKCNKLLQAISIKTHFHTGEKNDVIDHVVRLPWRVIN